jgi:hypothetical protein
LLAHAISRIAPEATLGIALFVRVPLPRFLTSHSGMCGLGLDIRSLYLFNLVLQQKALSPGSGNTFICLTAYSALDAKIQQKLTAGFAVAIIRQSGE